VEADLMERTMWMRPDSSLVDLAILPTFLCFP
jgi:hypothetical protein